VAAHCNLHEEARPDADRRRRTFKTASLGWSRGLAPKVHRVSSHPRTPRPDAASLSASGCRCQTCRARVHMLAAGHCRPKPQVSSNWSGYAATACRRNAPFKRVPPVASSRRSAATVGRTDSVEFWWRGGASEASQLVARANRHRSGTADGSGTAPTPTYKRVRWERCPSCLRCTIPRSSHGRPRLGRPRLCEGEAVDTGPERKCPQVPLYETLTPSQPPDVSSRGVIAEAPSEWQSERFMPWSAAHQVRHSDVHKRRGHCRRSPGHGLRPGWRQTRSDVDRGRRRTRVFGSACCPRAPEM